jgi:hypothetical protein
MTSLLVFSRDPGPTTFLIATIEALSEPGQGEGAGIAALRAAIAPAMAAGLTIAARAPGDAIWRAAGHAVKSWEGRDERAAETLLADIAAGAVLTGTSDVDDSGDRALWRAARKRGIESHAVFDHPANLELRFVDTDGASARPDWHYVPDQAFARRLAAAGIPANRIRVIGDLHHARLRRLAAGQEAAAIQRLRLRWGAGDAGFVVLFASECGREMAALGRPSPYDELEIFGELLQGLASGRRPDGGALEAAQTVVVVRPHPRDAEDKYAAFAGGREKLKIVVSAKESPPLALLAADLVVGMNSSLLYEAREIGRPVVSLTGHDIAAGKSRAG